MKEKFAGNDRWQDPNEVFRANIKRYPRLTKEQNAVLFDELAKEKGLPPVPADDDKRRKRAHLQELQNNIQLQKTITDAQRAQFDHAFTTCDSIKDLIFKGSVSLVYTIVNDSGRGTASEDMIQAGMIGLQKAIDNFNPSKGRSFFPYAKNYIIGEIKDEKGTEDDIKLPRNRRIAVNTLHNIISGLRVTLEREPTADEVCAQLDPNAYNYKILIGMLQNTLSGLYGPIISYNTPVGTNGLELIDVLPVSDSSAEDNVMRSRDSEAMTTNIKKSLEQIRNVSNEMIEIFHQLHFEGYDIEDIAKKYNKSPREIRKINRNLFEELSKLPALRQLFLDATKRDIRG